MKNNMRNLTVIIPIGNLKNDEDFEMLKAAVKSTCGNKTIVVGPTESIEAAKRHGIDGITLLENKSGDFSYQGNLMYAINEVKTEYFSPMEYDDTYTDIWFSNVERYLKYDTSNTFAFLPLTELTDYKTGNNAGYANEAVWASSFSDEMGCYDMQSLMYYTGFNVSGGVFRKDTFVSIGGLKVSMKMTFWYEFLLRALYKEKRIYVIPKIGCLHTVNRPGSLSDSYRQSMSDDEAEWWIELAKQEYFFPQDRNKQYSETE